MPGFEPPPRRTGIPTPSAPSTSSTPEKKSWKDKMKATGKKAMDKGVVISDRLGTRVNDVAEKRFGTEAFWPVTGDFPKEMDKCARILKAFTVDGIIKEEKADKMDKVGKVKMLRKIPPKVFKEAKGVAIFTSMRTGIAPFGGAGGAGIVIAKLPDGSWSAPASISPNNLSTGFLLGIDVYDCILVIRTQKALDSFKTHKFTLGVETAVAVGPYGGGAAVEAGIEKAPVLSYVRSKGAYAGVELVGQVFVERFEENAAQYWYPGIKAGEILSGKVQPPKEAENLIRALYEAESGIAQHEKGGLDAVIGAGPNGTDLDVDEGMDIPTSDEKGASSTPLQIQTPNESRSATPMGQRNSLSTLQLQSDSRRSSTASIQKLAPGERRMPPPPPPRATEITETLQRPQVSTHSSVSQYSDGTEEKSPTIDEVRETAARMHQLDIENRGAEGGLANEDAPIIMEGQTTSNATHVEQVPHTEAAPVEETAEQGGKSDPFSDVQRQEPDKNDHEDAPPAYH